MPSLTPAEQIAALRSPIQIFTQDFLDNPIRFNTDSRFDVETKLRETNQLAIINRDGADFAMVDIGTPVIELYPITMYTIDYDRMDVQRKIVTIISAFRES